MIWIRDRVFKAMKFHHIKYRLTLIAFLSFTIYGIFFFQARLNILQLQTPFDFKTDSLHGYHGNLPELNADAKHSIFHLMDAVPLNRNITDARDYQCQHRYNQSRAYLVDSLQLSVSVLIVISPGELPFPVLRNIHGILNRSPQSFIVEILLIDDASDGDDTHWLYSDVIQRHIVTLPKLNLRRTPARLGILGSRNLYYLEAIGFVIVFLDSYVEVNAGWLEPIIERLVVSPNSLVFPQLDWQDHGYSVFPIICSI